MRGCEEISFAYIADMSALNGLALSHASPVWQRGPMSLVQFLPNVVVVRFGVET